MTSNSPAIIHITDLTTVLPTASSSCRIAQLTVARGDLIAMQSQAPADGRHLLRILATLTVPASGRFRFDGRLINLEDYRQCLSIKRRVGYVAGDAAMISNRTLRENLILTRIYHENDLAIDLDAITMARCAAAGLVARLHQRPSALNDDERFKAIMIREMAKSPAVMLVERPETVLDVDAERGLFYDLIGMVHAGTALVLLTNSRRVIHIAGRRWIVSHGGVRDVRNPAGS